jgi:carboxyl-terminal processing protease
MHMKQKRFWIWPLLFLMAMLFVAARADLVDQTPNAAPKSNSNTIPIQDIQRFAAVIAQIKRYYIEPVDDKTLFNNAIRGMLSNLDPHSAFLDANDMKDLETVTTGEFGGIGVEVMPENGFIKVITPLDDNPAFHAGVKAGDLIVRIDNKLLKDMTVEQAINLIRGKKGSYVTLTLLRKGITNPVTVKVVRDTIKVQAVKSHLLENGYGYLRIAVFQAPTKDDMVKAINQLLQQSKGNLKGLVLDLRNNPGGLLDSAVDVADTFLDPAKLGKNKLIVYTKGRVNGANIEANATTGKKLLENVPMVVLVNQGSASASEIVAGALQDHKRAIILGTRSFGKGSVQTVIPIDYDTGIKLTTALYYTPNGRSIQATGIVPDVMVPELQIAKRNKTQEDDFNPIHEADLRGHLLNGNGKSKDKDVNATKENENQNAQPAAEENFTGDAEDFDQQQQKDRKSEQALATDDYQLYEALVLLKGLFAAQR